MWSAREFMSGSEGGQLVPTFGTGCRFPQGICHRSELPVGHPPPVHIRCSRFPCDNVVVFPPRSLCLLYPWCSVVWHCMVASVIKLVGHILSVFTFGDCSFGFSMGVTVYCCPQHCISLYGVLSLSLLPRC